MSGECLLDRQPTGDSGYLCRRCTARLRRDLDAVPDLVADLLITLTRQDHVQAVQPRGGGGTPLAYSPGASEELTDLRYYLASWVRCVGEQLHGHGHELDVVTSPAAHAAWLRRRLHLIRHLDMVDDLATEIGKAVADARRATDVPNVSSRFLVGPCPQVIESAWFCDGDVLATITTTGDDPPTMTCLRCEHVWPPETWLRAGKLIKRRSDETGWTAPRPQQRVDA